LEWQHLPVKQLMPTLEGRPPPWLSFISLRFRLAIASFLSTSFFKILFFIFYLLLKVTFLADTYLTQIRTKIPLFCEKKLSLVNQKLLLEYFYFVLLRLAPGYKNLAPLPGKLSYLFFYDINRVLFNKYEFFIKVESFGGNDVD
jgi:hypothetical protein